MTTRRDPKPRLRSRGGRTASQIRWLERQLADRFVAEAKKRGYRARSVFKLQEIDEKYGVLRKGLAVVDLGAAPGSWTQYAVQKGCRVVACDLLEMQPVPGARFMRGDFTDPDVQARLLELLEGPADVVLSDAAPSTTGLRNVDRLKSEALAEAVLDFAERALRPGGTCLLKLVKGAEAALRARVRERFSGWRLIRPAATRAESSEIFLLATGFRGGEEPPADPEARAA
ncbi:MAG: RlmE family RNA methyltransferase [Geminicoccaceae bacterium]|nr:RlmE family RNA methyltransferase [Geminicoccaceae bacterium]